MHPSEELCDDKLLTTVDGFSTLNDCTGSNRTFFVLGMCAAQSSHRVLRRQQQCKRYDLSSCKQ